MSYNVTITAQSLEELADKALALGGRLTLASGRTGVTAAEIVEVVRQATPIEVTPTPAEPAAPADQHQQVVAEHGRRQHEGQRDHHRCHFIEHRTQHQIHQHQQ